MRGLTEHELRNINTMANAIIKKSLVFFIGAGFSQQFGYPGWGKLLKEIIDDYKLKDELSSLQLFKSVNEEEIAKYRFSEHIPDKKALTSEINDMFIENLIGVDYLRLAGYIDFLLNKNCNKSIHSIIIKKLKEYESKPKDHVKYKPYIEFFKKYSKNFEEFITTNYDTNIEYCLEYKVSSINRNFDSIYKAEYPVKLYKIHGCIRDIDDGDNSNSNTGIVITEKDYHNFILKNKYLFYKTYSIFAEKKVVFIGYSINDPNIRSLLNDVIEESNNKLKLQVFWINKYKISELEKQYYKKIYNIEIIDEIELIEFINVLDERITKNEELLKIEQADIEQKAEHYIINSEDSFEREGIIESGKEIDVLRYTYSKIIKGDGMEYYAVRAFLLLLSESSDEVYQQVSQQVMNVIKLESRIILYVTDTVMENEKVETLFRNHSLLKDTFETLIKFAYSGAHPFGEYADCIIALLRYYKKFHELFELEEDEIEKNDFKGKFIEALYSNVRLAGKHGWIGYDYKGIEAIEKHIEALDPEFIYLLLDKYTNIWLNDVLQSQLSAIIYNSKLSEHEKEKAAFRFIHKNLFAREIAGKVRSTLADKLNEATGYKADYYGDSYIDSYNNYKIKYYSNKEDYSWSCSIIEENSNKTLLTVQLFYDEKDEKACIKIETANIEIENEKIMHVSTENIDEVLETIAENIRKCMEEFCLGKG